MRGPRYEARWRALIFFFIEGRPPAHRAVPLSSQLSTLSSPLLSHIVCIPGGRHTPTALPLLSCFYYYGGLPLCAVSPQKLLVLTAEALARPPQRVRALRRGHAAADPPPPRQPHAASSRTAARTCGELHLARATAPSPRGPTPPRCSRAAAAVADRLVESHRSRLQQKAGGRRPQCRAAAEPTTQWPRATTVASTHSTDCRALSQAIGTPSRRRKRIAISEGAATGGHARGDAHPAHMAERRRRARASRTQAANTPHPIRAPAWMDASAQQARARARVPQGARGAARRELGRRPRAPDHHGSRGVHRRGVPTPQGRLERVACPAAKETAETAAGRLQGAARCDARLRTMRRQAAHRATLGSAPCNARLRTVRRFGPAPCDTRLRTVRRLVQQARCDT